MSNRELSSYFGQVFAEQIKQLQEGAEEHEKLKDHTKNPFHKILTQHGFQHQSTEHSINPLARNNPKADSTEHRYVHPDHGKSHVIVTQEHSLGGGGYVSSDDKMNSFLHRHEQENGIMAPSRGDSKPQLHRELSYHYGVPKGMEAPKLTAWEKKSPRFNPNYKMNEANTITKTCWQCRGTGVSGYQDKHGNCKVCHGSGIVPDDSYPSPPKSKSTEKKMTEGFKVMSAFGGKLISNHSSEADAHKKAAEHSHKEPVHIWTTKGGAFGKGKVVAHYNEGKRTTMKEADDPEAVESHNGKLRTAFAGSGWVVETGPKNHPTIVAGPFKSRAEARTRRKRILASRALTSGSIWDKTK